MEYAVVLVTYHKKKRLSNCTILCNQRIEYSILHGASLRRLKPAPTILITDYD